MQKWEGGGQGTEGGQRKKGRGRGTGGGGAGKNKGGAPGRGLKAGKIDVGRAGK